MKSLIFPLAFAFGTNLLVSQLSAQAQTGSNGQCGEYKKGSKASESFKLYYNRDASVFKQVLSSIIGAGDCIGGTVVESQGDNTIVLYGTNEQRKALERVITVLDLPRERVNMEMWGILISSDNPEQLAKVMREVNQEIDKTQKLLRETYSKLEDLAKNIEIDPDYKYLLETVLGYSEALDKDRSSLSMIDVLLRINAANEPVDNLKTTAKNICKLFEKEPYKDYVNALIEYEGKTPFGNYQEVGLLREKTKQQDCSGKTKLTDNEIKLKNLNRRRAVLNFALQYSELVINPAKFDPEELRKSAEELNSVLTPLVDAINRDVEDLFIEPTLKKIQSIVSKYHNVQYAEIGKTSVAGLNGINSKVTSETVSTFDETGPLRLNEWLDEAGQVNDSVQKLLPNILFEGSTIPVSSLISAVAALSKDNSQWRGLTSGVSIDVTPSVLRNSQSAELKIDFTTGPEKAMTEEKTSEGSKLRPLSRIGQSKVSTTVYVQTLDLFALSTFNNQTTEDGGRGYIPLIGPIWKGFFSGLPIVGDLFSWQNAPNSVQHQSIALTNTFIVPTAMGVAHLYDSNSQTIEPFDFRKDCVKQYLNSFRPQPSKSYTFNTKCNDLYQPLR